MAAAAPGSSMTAFFIPVLILILVFVPRVLVVLLTLLVARPDPSRAKSVFKRFGWLVGWLIHRLVGPIERLTSHTILSGQLLVRLLGDLVTQFIGSLVRPSWRVHVYLPLVFHPAVSTGNSGKEG